MNSSTTDKVRGTAKEVAGKVKEETGKAVGNPNLEDRGTTEKIAGKVMKRGGKLVGVDMNKVAKLAREAQARNYKAAGVPDKRI